MNPADVLKYGHGTVLKTLEGLPESQWETDGVCGVWSVKDIMAHLASYEHWLEEVLAPFAGLKIEMPIMTQLGQIGAQGFNDTQVEARRGKSPTEVRREYEEMCTRILQEIVPKVPVDIWPKTGTLPWYGDEYSLDDFIVYTFYGHKREHTAQINVFKDTLK
jgi:mycothiol maleylpyruvate isomerase-like protein